MGKATLSDPAKIITGFIFNDTEIFNKAAHSLSKKLGPVDLESGLFLFEHTQYYNDEMGSGLKRRFISFKRLRGLEEIYRLKSFTNKLEMGLSLSRRRRINIDPGYLTPSKLVLFTTKDYGHRIYIKDGVYAEVTLYFKNKSYQPQEWTYPDYRTEDYIGFFNKVREEYLKDLKRAKQ